jgi:chromate transporter
VSDTVARTTADARPDEVSALGEVSAAFLKLGLISFGGPIAHLGYFHTEFVQRRRWIDDPAYADLVALCQFLPGPASSQVVFALGMRRAGLAGALAASACFMLPSVVVMIAFAYGVSRVAGLEHQGWVHGLKLAAVAVVAQAVWSMWAKLCPDAPRMSMALGAAAALLVAPGAWTQVGAIGAGALAGWFVFKSEPSRASDRMPASPMDCVSGACQRSPGRLRGSAPIAALLTFALLLVLLPIGARASGSRDVAVFDSFYRSGSLVFGGGHVVLPLLREEVVPAPHAWMSDDAFLAGYGMAQAVPGPLFTFSAYLGTVIYAGPRAWLGGIFCLLAIFLPAWLLIGGALPFWDTLRTRVWARAALKGAGAAVVGVLLAALYTPVCTQGIRGARDVAAAVVAFALLHVWKTPPIVVVALCAAAGQWVL